MTIILSQINKLEPRVSLLLSLLNEREQSLAALVTRLSLHSSQVPQMARELIPRSLLDEVTFCHLQATAS